jgi:photosystem II stability/assembly factor-like uncharacterized protein
VYSTQDGGESWSQVLGLGEFTGANEVVRDPSDPDVLFASMHQRYRNVAALINGGPETGIYKSTDAGGTWREVTQGLPEGDMGRIGLAVSPFDSQVVYATIEQPHREGGFYRSDDGGESWAKQNDYLSGGTGPHYYQEIFASPHHEGSVYQMDVWMRVTHDHGETFERVGETHKHSDNHALAFNDDPDYLLAGCDGGLYESFDLGATWRFAANMPITQFYKVAVDDDAPFYNVYGGTQDNNSQMGPSRTDGGGIRNADWRVTLGGDGHDQATDTENPDILYVEWQEGHLNRFDRRTGEAIDIQPQPREGEESERYNWDAPILTSPHDPARVYFASQRVWRSDDRGDSWTPVSGDLTSGVDRLTLPMMGRVQSIDATWDLWAMSKYATITSLAVSPEVEGLLYAGTDDGHLQVTEDGGATWRATTSLPGVADGWFVNDVKADLHDADAAYVCVDQHKAGDFTPYVFKTTDRGKTWTSIAGDLPDRHLAWRLVQDHVRPELLFLGTEFGVYFTVDGGARWVELTGGAPNIPFRDLELQRREDDLVCATFGRSFYVLDDYAPLREVTEEVLAAEGHLFAVRDAHWYVERSPLGDADKASQGDAYFVAENPPFGAVLTYYLRDGHRTSKEARAAAETEKIEAGEDTPTPGWDVLEVEGREVAPQIVFTVTDDAGNVVRRFSGPATAGLHRVAWDLRYPSVSAWSEPVEREPWESPDAGFLVMPGTYTASMALLWEGSFTPLGEPRSFQVTPLRDGALPRVSPAEMSAFHRRFEDASRDSETVFKAVEERLGQVEAVREVLLRSRDVHEDEFATANALRHALLDLRRRLHTDEARDSAGDPGPVSLSARFFLLNGLKWSTHGPTGQQRDVLGLLVQDLAGIRADYLGLEDRLEAFYGVLDGKQVPWTPGRRVIRR